MDERVVSIKRYSIYMYIMKYTLLYSTDRTFLIIFIYKVLSVQYCQYSTFLFIIIPSGPK